MSVFHIFDMGI